jgi:hypothetical protein
MPFIFVESPPIPTIIVESGFPTTEAAIVKEKLYELPLIAQQQSLRISLGGVYYNISVEWNESSSNWNINLSDDNGLSILNSIPLLTCANILEQFDYLRLGGNLRITVDSDNTSNPTYNDLGQTSHVYFVTS